MIRGVRGATTLSEDSATAMAEALLPLLQALVDQNDIEGSAISSVFFTMTSDLTKASAPQVARQGMAWGEVPVMCAVEPDVEGFPARCVRVLIQFETEKLPSQLRHLYQKGAVQLRPDLQA